MSCIWFVKARWSGQHLSPGSPSSSTQEPACTRMSDGKKSTLDVGALPA